MGFAVRGLTYTRWGGITFDTGQIAKDTNEVMFVQIYVQHLHLNQVKLSITSLYLILYPINVFLADRKVTTNIPYMASKISYDA